MYSKLLLLTLASSLALGGCGNKLNKKTAKKVLSAAQKPVENTDKIMGTLYKSQIEDKKAILDIYKKAKLITSMQPKPGQNGFFTIGFNQKRINKKWGKWVSFVETPENAGGNRIVVKNYTTRVGDILRIDTKPVDHLCDALVEYRYEPYDFAPWGKDIAAAKRAGQTVYQACFIKYDKSWSAKDWRKKPARRRR